MVAAPSFECHPVTHPVCERISTMTLSPRRLIAVLSLSGLCLLASCGKFFVDENGGGGSTTCSSNCVYVGNYNSTAADSDVAAFAAVNPLAIVSNVNIALGDNPVSMVVDPTNTYLYSASADGVIYSFPIQDGGSLGTIATAVPETGIAFSAITIDPSGAYLLGIGTVASSTTCASTGYAVVAVFPVQAGGTLGDTPSIYSGGDSICVRPTAVVVAADNSNVFVALGDLGIQGFTLDTNAGTITAGHVVHGITNTNFNGLAVDSQSQYLFATASGTAGGVYEYKVSNLGIVGTGQDVGTTFYPIVVDHSNTYVYAADNNNGNVYGYTFSSGGLTAISGSPFAPSSSSNGTPGMVTDSSGQFVLTINNINGPNLQEFTIGSGGVLAASSTGTTGSASGYAPATIAITQ